jgi:hypothetical protein
LLHVEQVLKVGHRLEAAPAQAAEEIMFEVQPVLVVVLLWQNFPLSHHWHVELALAFVFNAKQSLHPVTPEHGSAAEQFEMRFAASTTLLSRQPCSPDLELTAQPQPLLMQVVQFGNDVHVQFVATAWVGEHAAVAAIQLEV